MPAFPYVSVLENEPHNKKHKQDVFHFCESIGPGSSFCARDAGCGTGVLSIRLIGMNN